MRKIQIILLSLILSACAFTIRIEPGYEFEYSPTDTVTPVTVIPTETSQVTETQTVQPSATFRPTATATETPTSDPTPTREIGAIVRLLFNSRIRSNPSIRSEILRVGIAGEQFTVLSQRDGWLSVAGDETSGWLFFGSWVEFTSGNIEDVPISQGVSKNRLGYNVLEVYEEPYFFNHIEALCPEYMLVMDNLSLAVRLYEHLNPSCGTEVIHRNYSHFEGEEYLNRSPFEIVDNWKREGYPHIIRYSTNEPSCGGNTHCSVLVAHEVEIARLAREEGYTVSLGNLGVGKFPPQDVTDGVYNPLIQAIYDNDQIFGAHEYTWGCLCFGFGTMPTSYFLDPTLMQESLWVDGIGMQFAPIQAQNLNDSEQPFGVEQLEAYYAQQFASQMASQSCGDLPPYWHMGRSFWILLWAECTLGIDPSGIEVVHTEWGWDYMSDVNEVIEPLRRDFEHPQYEYNLRGWRSLEYLWSNWWGWSIEESAFRQIEFAIRQYPDNHHFLLFAWSDDASRDWTRAGFSFGNYGDGATIRLHELLEG